MAALCALLGGVHRGLDAQSIMRLQSSTPSITALTAPPDPTHYSGLDHPLALAIQSRRSGLDLWMVQKLQRGRQREARRDYTWVGVAVGAAILGTAGFVGGYGLCHDLRESSTHSCTGNTIAFGVMGIGIGTVLGGFIGSSIPRGSPDSTAAAGP